MLNIWYRQVLMGRVEWQILIFSITVLIYTDTSTIKTVIKTTTSKTNTRSFYRATF